MKNLFLIYTIILITPIFSLDTMWTEYPTCKYGRLQSPIKLNEYDSTYSNSFSFVYQNYKDLNLTFTEDQYTLIWNITDENSGGYVNFEKEGVIKQYELIRIELYPGEHDVDGIKGNYELHLIHKKNLNFNSNKNQYRKIVDANMFLTVVLRYTNDQTYCNQAENNCISDNGLLSDINSASSNINLNKYPIYQDKRAYLYEGSFLHIPCDENVNYYIIKDLFYSDFNVSLIANINTTEFNQIKKEAGRYGRPVLKNFMNYREFLEGNNLRINFFYLTLIIFILFNF